MCAAATRRRLRSTPHQHEPFSVVEWNQYGRHPVDAPRPAADASDDLPLSSSSGFSTQWRVGAWAVAIFLPQGWPASVSPDYAQYQFYDSVQGLCSYVMGVIATHAILKGMGVGSASASAIAATTQFVVKDMSGMMANIGFAYWKGSSLDSNSKTWRLVADVLNDVALGLELLSPLFPSFFLHIACVGSVARAVVGVAGGATKAAVQSHQARDNNTADVSAKDGSQETAVRLLGMLLGLLLTSCTSILENPAAIAVLFFISVSLHLYSNVCALRSLVMDSLNEQRLSILWREYLSTGRVLTAVEVSQRESILAWPCHRYLSFLVGSQPSRVWGGPLSLCPTAEEHCTRFSPYAYVVYVACHGRRRSIHCVLHEDATDDECVRAFVHGESLADEICGSDDIEVTEAKVMSLVGRRFPRFLKEMTEQGWSSAKLLLGTRKYHVCWTIPTKKEAARDWKGPTKDE